MSCRASLSRRCEDTHAASKSLSWLNVLVWLDNNGCSRQGLGPMAVVLTRHFSCSMLTMRHVNYGIAALCGALLQWILAYSLGFGHWSSYVPSSRPEDRFTQTRHPHSTAEPALGKSRAYNQEEIQPATQLRMPRIQSLHSQLLHVLKLHTRPGDLFPKIEHGAPPGYLYTGKIPQRMPVRYLAPRKHGALPQAAEAVESDIRHLFIFDVRPPTYGATHTAAWGPDSLQSPLSRQQMQTIHWAKPGHTLGLGVFRDEQGQIPYAQLDSAPWAYIFRTFWHNELPGTERPNIPLGTMSCRGTAHVRWAAAMTEHLTQLRALLRKARPPKTPPLPNGKQGGVTLLLVQNGGGGGYAPGKGGPRGGWWPDRPLPGQRRTRPGGLRQRGPRGLQGGGSKCNPTPRPPAVGRQYRCQS